jgi:hypothetical protein
MSTAEIDRAIRTTALFNSESVAKLVILGEEAEANNDTTGLAILKSAVRYACSEAGLEIPEDNKAQQNQNGDGEPIVVCKSPYR